MKPIILILCMFLVTSCNNDDNSTQQENNELLGTWYLVSFEQFGPIYNYDDEEIKWTFNANDTVFVEIIDGTEVDSSLLLNNSGTYSYSIFNNGITIDSMLYPFEINNNTLIILMDGGPSVDGKQLSFIKAE